VIEVGDVTNNTGTRILSHLAAEKFIPSPLHETLLEKPQAIRVVEHDDALSRGSQAPEPVDITAPEPLHAQHAIYRSLIDLVPSYNPIE
jgi:hypothetical protein